jgi:hypothetical protein
MTGLISPKVRSILGIHEQGALSVLSQNKTGIPAQTINENSVQALKAEKLQPLEIPSTENQSQPSVDSQSVSSPHLVPEAKAAPSAFIEKYEMGSGKNKINVRIFKEPTAESVSLEPQKDANTKRVDTDALALN